MNYYLTSLRKENYEIIEENGFNLIGFNEKSLLAEQLSKGDILIIYIGSRESKIVGYIEVVDKYYWDNELIWDDIFPKRVKIKPKVILNDSSKINVKDLVSKLSFVSNKKRYGMSFLAGIRRIPAVDAVYIIEEIERRKNNAI